MKYYTKTIYDYCSFRSSREIAIPNQVLTKVMKIMFLGKIHVPASVLPQSVRFSLTLIDHMLNRVR